MNSFFIWVPRRMVKESYSSPVSVGLYTIISRQWLAEPKGSSGAALSDLELCDLASLERGTLKHYIKGLEEQGWIKVQRQKGIKTRYVPCWGKAKPWSKTEKSLGRGTIKTEQIPTQLIDLYVGRIYRNSTKPGLIERYLKSPLSARAVGEYIIAKMGLRAPLTAELRVNLLQLGTNILAPSTSLYSIPFDRLSDRAKRLIEAASTKRRKNFLTMSMIRIMIDIMIDNMISPVASDIKDSSLSEALNRQENNYLSLPWIDNGNETGIDGSSSAITSALLNLQKTPVCIEEESILENEETNNFKKSQLNRKHKNLRRPTLHKKNIYTPTEELLHKVGVYPSIAQSLLDIPPEVIESIIDDLKNRPSVKNKAGWVSTVAKSWRSGFGLPSTAVVRTIPTSERVISAAETPSGIIEPDHEDPIEVIITEPVLSTPPAPPARPDWIPELWWSGLPIHVKKALEGTTTNRYSIQGQDAAQRYSWSQCTDYHSLISNLMKR